MKAGTEFTMNMIGWKVLDIYDSWIFVEGYQMTPSGKIKIYDCGMLQADETGNLRGPITLGFENSLLNRNKEEIRARFERGKEKIEADKSRKVNNLQYERDVLAAEEKRVKFLSGMEEKKVHAMTELNDLYDKSTKPEGITSNKRAMDLLQQISAYDIWRYYHRHTIFKL